MCSYDRQEIDLKGLSNLWGIRREGKFDDFMVLISTEVMLRQRLSVRDSASLVIPVRNSLMLFLESPPPPGGNS